MRPPVDADADVAAAVEDEDDGVDGDVDDDSAVVGAGPEMVVPCGAAADGGGGRTVFSFKRDISLNF